MEARGVLSPTFGQQVTNGTMDERAFDLEHRGSGYVTFGLQHIAPSGHAQWELIGWTAAGKIDPTFQTNGITDFGPTTLDYGYAIGARSDGGYLLTGDATYAGVNGDDVQIASVDASGVVMTGSFKHFDSNDRDTSSAIMQTPGGAVVCATAGGQTVKRDFWLIGTDASGALDGAFGIGGYLFGLNPPSPGDDRCFDLALDANGLILASGVSNGAAIVARVLPNGTYDAAFGTNGVATSAMNAADAFGVLVLPDGNIIAAGDDQMQAGIAELDPSGTVMWAHRYPLGDTNVILDIQRQPNGKLVAVGQITTGATTDAFALRVLPDGTPDATFGTNGVVTIDFGANDVLNALRIDASGLVVAVGRRGHRGSPPGPGRHRVKVGTSL